MSRTTLDALAAELRRRIQTITDPAAGEGKDFHRGATAAYLDLLRWVRAERLKLGD